MLTRTVAVEKAEISLNASPALRRLRPAAWKDGVLGNRAGVSEVSGHLQPERDRATTREFHLVELFFSFVMALIFICLTS